jgi:hypothetical protein
LVNLLLTLVGFILTLMVFSYLIGDNPLFRLATYLFVGVSAGYIAAVIIDQVFWARLAIPLLTGTLNDRLLTLVPLFLCILLVFKLSPKTSRVGNLPMGFLVGIGAAVIIGGAVSGTLFGQINGAVAPFNLSKTEAGGYTMLTQFMDGALLLFGTICSLAYFHFGSPGNALGQPLKRPAFIENISKIGQVFIAITLGALLSGVFIAATTALIERIDFIRTTITSLFS